ncbi:MAG: dCTP deaminase [Elusimicrobia bacterium]|nr:dCTP deaminase [Elusimicrobiota bacterium]
MTTLSVDEIRKRLQATDDSRIILTPLLEPKVDPGTIDVRLGRHFIAFRSSRYLGVEPVGALVEEGSSHSISEVEREEEFQVRLERTVERIFVPLGHPFALHPYELVLACTLEYIALPRDVGAYVLSRSSTGRLGILSATATYIHPGFRGVVTLELVNTGPTAIEITPGMRIAQFALEEAHLSGPGSGVGPQSVWQFSTRPDIARLTRESDMPTLAWLNRPRPPTRARRGLRSRRGR